MIKSGKEPWDRGAQKSDVEFWKHHGLVAPAGVNICDDLGDEGYLTRLLPNNFLGELDNYKASDRMTDRMLYSYVS